MSDLPVVLPVRGHPVYPWNTTAGNRVTHPACEMPWRVVAAEWQQVVETFCREISMSRSSSHLCYGARDNRGKRNLLNSLLSCSDLRSNGNRWASNVGQCSELGTCLAMFAWSVCSHGQESPRCATFINSVIKLTDRMKKERLVLSLQYCENQFFDDGTLIPFLPETFLHL